MSSAKSSEEIAKKLEYERSRRSMISNRFKELHSLLVKAGFENYIPNDQIGILETAIRFVREAIDKQTDFKTLFDETQSTGVSYYNQSPEVAAFFFSQ